MILWSSKIAVLNKDYQPVQVWITIFQPQQPRWLQPYVNLSLYGTTVRSAGSTTLVGICRLLFIEIKPLSESKSLTFHSSHFNTHLPTLDNEKVGTLMNINASFPRDLRDKILDFFSWFATCPLRHHGNIVLAHYALAFPSAKWDTTLPQWILSKKPLSIMTERGYLSILAVWWTLCTGEKFLLCQASWIAIMTIAFQCAFEGFSLNDTANVLAITPGLLIL